MTADQERQSASLMRRAQAGDEAAYATLLHLLASLAHEFARRRLGAAACLDDAVQETLLAIHAARQTYDSRRPFAPWFYAIAAHRLIDVVRRERRVQAREVAGDDLPERGVSIARERGRVDPAALRAAVAGLPGRQREIITSLKYRDQSVREVAARLGMTESAVKVTAHRGYRLLKRLLAGGV